MIKTPFAEYREEQVKVNIFDYFVEPSFFEKFCDTKPILISGSRGTGKTTILKVLTLAESKDYKKYLEENNYIGVYYRVDLNITTSFRGEGLEQRKWEKLFSYYFVAKLSYELINQFIGIKSLYSIDSEVEVCQKYAVLFTNVNGICSLEELSKIIFDELYRIRDYINNCAFEDYPHIGDYATIIRELPQDLLRISSTSQLNEKTIFYLIDEFEGLFEWQQKLVLSFLKYSDKYHTYKICMRPDGLKTSQTMGAEYVRETDDIRTIDLNELILENREDYYKYALDVCKKRMELFYKKNDLNNISNIQFEKLFEKYTEEQEFDLIFGKIGTKLNEDIQKFILEINLKNPEIEKYLYNNYFDFLICRLMYLKNKKKESFEKVVEHVWNKDQKYIEAVGNYKNALIYYLCLRFSLQKNYSGFNTLVNISGGTLRYLLELCNEIFERAASDYNFNYEEPDIISAKIQTEAVMLVSSKRVNQISAIPQIGLNMRTFVISLGKIYRIFHRDDKIAKFEPNHFSIKTSKASIDEDILLFLKECVMRGVLLKKRNNKNKSTYMISADEYLYMLHPIYTPSFQISWRRKQKAEFDLMELKVLVSNDSKEINNVIRKYQRKYLTEDTDMPKWDYYQMELDF